ncbi:hypothetical protein [Streptomyces sp. NPDC127197]|uniref:hypothetical protein n=1 Tax=Streptomyces sp. NPDC127197 TaxID=3345388 RepID=UPI003636D188
MIENHPEMTTETTETPASPHGIPFAQHRPLGDTEAAAEAKRIIAAAYQEADRVPVTTRFADPTPVPSVGTTPPVPQYGRPPMSQRATDASGLILATGVASLPVGIAATGILWASGQADPVVIGCICAAPTTLVLALSRLLRRGREVVEAAPPVHHHHYDGTVVQDHSTVTTTTKGVIARTRFKA